MLTKGIFSFLYYSILLFRSCRYEVSSCFNRRNNKTSANRSDIINITKTLCQPYPETKPAKKGPTAAPEKFYFTDLKVILLLIIVYKPIDPVPSIMAVTVAKALEFPSKQECVPSSAETAVVINAYGPFTKTPTTINNNIFTPKLTALKC